MAQEYVWIGKVSSAWNQSDNWRYWEIPLPNSDIIINGGCPYQPVSNSNLQINQLILEDGASLEVNELQVNQVTVNGNATLQLSKDSMNSYPIQSMILNAGAFILKAPEYFLIPNVTVTGNVIMTSTTHVGIGVIHATGNQSKSLTTSHNVEVGYVDVEGVNIFTIFAPYSSQGIIFQGTGTLILSGQDINLPVVSMVNDGTLQLEVGVPGLILYTGTVIITETMTIPGISVRAATNLQVAQDKVLTIENIQGKELLTISGPGKVIIVNG